MSRRVVRAKVDEPGGDSFLDVVANLVGILIILVVVVGAGTRSAAMALAKHAAEPPPEETTANVAQEPDQWQAEVATAAEKMSGVQAAFNEVEQRIAQEKMALQLREQERAQVQVVVTVAENRINQYRNELSTSEQEKFDIEKDLAAAEDELKKLDQARRVAGEEPPPEVLEHFPTPMARTVFGTELHFRLQNGRITFVPWDELVARLKADAPTKVHRLRETDRIEETLAPFAGFVLKYALRKVTGGGPARVELDRFVLIPIHEPMGEPVRQALANPRSDLMSRLNEFGPNRATLTVWTYPDSFEDFRILKAEMYKRGFLTAARPLPTGMPIGGSPDGSRSSAE